MSRLGWPHVAVVAIVVTGVVVLAVFNRDTTAFIGLAVAILIGIGLVQQGEIKSAANGSATRLIALLETMAEHLRQLPPPPPPTINGEVSSTSSVVDRTSPPG